MKQQKNKLVVLGLALAIGLWIALPAVGVHAAQCGQVQTSIDLGCGEVSGNGDIGDAGIYKLLIALFNFLAIGVGIAVVGGIIFGGLTFMTARGNSGQTQKAITIIVNAVIGLLLFIFMYAIINFIVPGGLL